MLVLPGLVSRIGRHEFLAKHYASFGFGVWVLDFRGRVALQVFRKYPKMFELSVLEAPMVRMKTAPFQFFLAEPMAYIFKNWFGQGKQYCLGHGNYNPIQESFKYNRNFRDRTLFDQLYFIHESHKELIPRDPR